jgi:glutamate-1-semialdehyde 2,1-aminomutase
VLSARLAEGLERAARDAGIPHVVQRVGSMLTLFFHDGPVYNYEEAKQSDTKRFARYFWEMLARGVYLPCSQFEAAFVSAAHTEADIEYTISAACESMNAIGG